MRLSIVALAAALTLALAGVAEAREPRKPRKPASASGGEGYYSRPSTVDRRGLCQRDNGRPLNSLNLNQQCDREEFWARINERGNDRN